MDKGKIIVAGIGPGCESDMTPAVSAAIQNSDVIIGYKNYFRYVSHLLDEGKACVNTDMKNEQERVERAFAFANEGRTVCVISSGDAGIYGITPLLYEMKEKIGSEVEIESYPGISAFQKAASLLGAPIGHDFCAISLSDLMTPWARIEKRIQAAAMADFVTAVYNPRSEGRYWQLYRLKELFLQERDPDTPVGYVRHAGREEEEVCVTTLAKLDPERIDMFTVILIGNSQTYFSGDYMITPRGYYDEVRQGKIYTGIGQDIMIRSFRTIEKELKDRNIPLDRKWALLHAIYTTADFDMEQLLYTDPKAVATLHEKIKSRKTRMIITDVTMAISGIRKGALRRLGVEAKCYLQSGQAEQIASRQGITRAQAGIRLAVEEYPDALFVFGNAPTALMELCELIRKGKASPAGIIAAPVGFVNVQEAKQMVKPFTHIPKLIIEGRKGGSTLAATLTNAILCYDDANLLKPGRDV